MLEKDNVRTGFFELEQYETVRSHLPEALRPVIDLAYLTGSRKNEVLTLQWQLVNRQNKTIRLEPGTTKNKKSPTVNCGQHADLVSIIEQRWTAEWGHNGQRAASRASMMRGGSFSVGAGDGVLRGTGASGVSVPARAAGVSVADPARRAPLFKRQVGNLSPLVREGPGVSVPPGGRTSSTRLLFSSSQRAKSRTSSRRFSLVACGEASFARA